MMSMRKEPLIKTFTFAILHFTTAFLVVYALTGSIAIGGAVALIEPLCNTVVFYLHEKARRRFGRQRERRARGYGHDLILRYLRNREREREA